MCARQLKFFETEEDRNNNKRKTIAVPLDTLILLMIVVVLLFILSFSLGVEKGRRTVITNKQFSEKIPATSEVFPVSLNNVALEANSLSEEKTTQRESKIIAKKKQIPAKIVQNNEIIRKVTQELKPVNYEEEKYAVQVISCSGQTCAQEELKKLQNQGFPAYIAKKSNFFVVYAGNFKDKVQAQKNLELLKKTYKDCMLRTVK
jgi:preprotein translocase subunit SecF